MFFMIATYFMPIGGMTYAYVRIGVELWGSQSIGEATQRQLDNIRNKRRVRVRAERPARVHTHTPGLPIYTRPYRTSLLLAYLLPTCGRCLASREKFDFYYSTEEARRRNSAKSCTRRVLALCSYCSFMIVC